jgi:hypothetical protein
MLTQVRPPCLPISCNLLDLHLSAFKVHVEQAAFAAAAWLQRANCDGSLAGFFRPNLKAEKLGIANIAGWILGGV